MEKGEKRTRGEKWGHAQTIALAELKREAFLRKNKGRLAWEQISSTLSSRFPDHPKSNDQCRRRWDTLVKVYNHIEDFCFVTGTQDHRDLDEGELASMKLDTAYGEEWYEIVKQVCSQRKGKERFVRDHVVEKRKKAPSTGPHSVKFPEHPPNKSKSVAQHEQSTTICAQVSSSPSVGVDSLRLEEGVGRLQNGNSGSMLTETQTREHGQVSQENQMSESFNGLQQTFPVELGSQTRELQQDQVWDLVDAMPLTTPAEAEQSDSLSHLVDTFWWDALSDPSVLQFFPSIEPSVSAGSDQSTHELGHHSRSGYEISLYRSEGPDHRTHVWEFGAPESSLSYSFSEYEIGILSPEVSRLARPAAKLGPGTWVSRLADFRDRKPLKSLSLGVNFPGIMSKLIPSARKTACTTSRSAESTMSREGRRWSFKGIAFNLRQCFHAGGREESAESESKQADRLHEKTRKRALMSGKNTPPAKLNAASATRVGRGAKPVQNDTERIPKQAALGQRKEEIPPSQAEKQQAGSQELKQLCAERPVVRRVEQETRPWARARADSASIVGNVTTELE